MMKKTITSISFKHVFHGFHAWFADMMPKRMAVFSRIAVISPPSQRPKARKLQQSPEYVNAEPSKTPLERGLSSISLNCTLHLVPLAITSTIVYLNLSFVYWWDGSVQSTRRNNLLDMLQFVAKAHELCIGASIGTIVSHFAVFILCRRRGLPFGLVGADIQVGSFNIFFKKSFWSIWRRGRHQTHSEVAVFTFSLVFCSLLAAFSGPSSAIAIRPHLDWWQVANDTLDFKYHSAFDIWPMAILVTPSHVPTINCTVIVDTYIDSYYCPASGLNDLTTQFTGLNPILPGDPLNTTFGESTGQTRRLIRSSILSSDQTHAYSSTLSLVPQMVVASLWMNIKGGFFSKPAISQPKYVTDSKSSIKEPLVQVKCNAYAKSKVSTASPAINPPLFPVIPSLTSEHLTGLEVQGYPVPDYTFTGPNQHGFSLTWVNLYEKNRSASVGVVLEVPYAKYEPTSVTQDSVILPCTIDARWISTEISFDPTSADVISDSFTDLEDFLHLGQHIMSSNGSFAEETGVSLTDVINIDREWANLLSPITLLRSTTPGFSTSKFNSTGGPYNTTMIEEALQIMTLNEWNDTVSFNYLQRIYNGTDDMSEYFRHNRPYTFNDTQKFLSTYMGLVVADGLARYGMEGVFSESMDILGPESHFHKSPASSSLETPEETRENWHTWRFAVWRKGYSYGARDITTKLALAVLLTHAILAIGFIIYLWITGWTTRSWTSIGELIALALRSRSTKQFEGTDAGINRWETWAQNVRIREVDQGHLELRFGYDGCEEDKGVRVGKVEVGRKYGTEALGRPSPV